MLKIMIVEDDVFYRYEIRHFMKWEKYGFTVSAEAVNGKCAMEMIENDVPDLVLTDISMPEMNGIEFIKQLREHYPAVKCVVLSSYDDFNFVKDAMKLGAQDYILKYDLKEDDVAVVLETVKEQLQKEREEEKRTEFVKDGFSIISEEFLRKLLLNKKFLKENIQKLWDYMGKTNPPDNNTVVVVRVPESGEELRRQLRGLLESVISPEEFVVSVDGSGTFAVLMSLGHEKSTIRIFEYVTRKVTVIYQKIKESGISGFSIGVSDISSGFREIWKLYGQALKAQEQSLYEGYDKVWFYANLRLGSTPANLDDIIENFTEEIHEGQIERARQGLEAAVENMYETRPEKKLLEERFYILFHTLYKIALEEKIMPEAVLGFKVPSEERMRKFRSIQEMERHLLESYDRLADRLKVKEQTGMNINNRQAAQIMNYIEKNYMKELSLEILSEEFGLTPNYLCKIFKNSTGMKLTAYINQVRIEGAKKLIRGTNMRAHEIAEVVGFASASYFSTIFKQITGQTVSEYKDSIF